MFRSAIIIYGISENCLLRHYQPPPGPVDILLFLLDDGGAGSSGIGQQHCLIYVDSRRVE